MSKNLNTIINAAPAGIDGSSAYALAVAGGFTGNQAAWIASLVGATGAAGAAGAAGSTGSATLTASTLPFVIGAAGNGTSPFNGYMDDFRMTTGFARYTSTFTPPTSAFLTY